MPACQRSALRISPANQIASMQGQHAANERSGSLAGVAEARVARVACSLVACCTVRGWAALVELVLPATAAGRRCEGGRP